MARRGYVKNNKVVPDPVFGKIIISKLVNRVMVTGKKTVAQKQVYNALEIIKTQTGEDPLEVLERALNNLRPALEVRPRRVGGAVYQVPTLVRPERRDSLAIRWLVITSRTKSNSQFRTYAEKLASEIIDASKGEGIAIKKKKDVENMAEANRAFAHFKW